jgi:integrase/recombinase XerD
MSLELKRRAGSPYWYLRGTVRGQSVFETTGTDDKAAAEALRIQREAELLKQSVFGKKATVTFAEAAASYLAAGGSPRFLGEFDEATGQWDGLIGHFYSAKLHTIGQDELNAAAVKLYPNATPDTRNRQVYTPFIAVWNHAVGNQWAEFRKWSRPKKPKGTAVRFRPKRAGTFPVEYEVASQFVLAMSPAPAFVMTTLFYTGMRPIELFALEAKNINVPGRWIVVENSKIGEPRGVPMHEFLAPLLTALVRRGDPLWRTPKGLAYPIPAEDDEWGGGQMRNAVGGARKRSGLAGIAPYTARHTVSTQLVVNRVHQFVKDQIMGHAVTETSRVYTNVPQAPLIEAINTLPVIRAWAEAPWMTDPLAFARKVAGTPGRRNDLVAIRA